MRARPTRPLWAFVPLVGVLAGVVANMALLAASAVSRRGVAPWVGDTGASAVRAQEPLTSTFTPTPLATLAATATPQPDGVTITGTVRLTGPDGAEPGPGLAGVRLYRDVGVYPDLDAPSALSDARGHYAFAFLPLPPGPNQTVFLRPEKQGYVFLPGWRWHEYGGRGGERVALDFEARAIEGDPRARFELGFAERDQRFVIELRDPERIAAARAELTKLVDDRLGVMGQIVKQPADYNPDWSYHLHPGSIEFFDLAIEVCDSSPTYIEEHLDEVCGALLPRCTWCSWSSHIVAEVTAPETPGHLYLPALLAGAEPTP